MRPQRFAGGRLGREGHSLVQGPHVEEKVADTGCVVVGFTEIACLGVWRPCTLGAVGTSGKIRTPPFTAHLKSPAPAHETHTNPVAGRFVFRSVFLGVGPWASRVLYEDEACSYLALVVAACRGMSTSSNGSNSGDSGASFGGLRLEFLSTSSESLHIEVEREVREDPASEHSRIVTCTRLCRYAWTCVGRYLGAFGPLSVCVRAAMLGLALAAICVRLGPLPVCAWGRYLCAFRAAICVRLGPLSVCAWGRYLCALGAAICVRLGPLSVCAWGRYVCALLRCEVSGCQVYCNGVDVS
ncbi:hypothetical protein DEO72_LG2g3381 [Vigna unguiculata]|uniref:Uncharacterized protein n=1 Tax=Vigna unguiculata TaxID=3917 RepID=A0A4D6L3I8_VIGUN|nr:hypothetical protein DEO72_LG2g3381 [Vigna unguiculata]